MNGKFVTDLTLSKKLKKAGLPQNSQFYWHNIEKVIYHRADVCLSLKNFDRLYTSAFIDPELNKYLPANLDGTKATEMFIGKTDDGKYSIDYMGGDKYFGKSFRPPVAFTEVIAKGLMILKLLSKNLIKLS